MLQQQDDGSPDDGSNQASRPADQHHDKNQSGLSPMRGFRGDKKIELRIDNARESAKGGSYDKSRELIVANVVTKSSHPARVFAYSDKHAAERRRNDTLHHEEA